MQAKRKPSILRYTVFSLMLLCVVGFFLLSKADRFYMIYAVLFTVITALFDGTIISDWLEKRAEKRAENPLIK